MQVDEAMVKSAAFLGMPAGDSFVVDGTGFMAFVTLGEHDFAYFITARHLVWPDRRRNPDSPPTGNIYIRINRKADGFRIIQTVRAEWIFHPDKLVDLCAFPFNWSEIDQNEELDFSAIHLETMALRGQMVQFSGISLGDEVFITSAFVGRVGEKKNIPVVRIGNIAAMPDEPISFGSPRQPAYLIETKSLGGVSGAPVYLNMQPSRQMNRRTIPLSEVPYKDGNRKGAVYPYLLIGMVLGAHSGQYAPDFVSEDDSDIIPPKDVDFNAGLSVVLPVQYIIDFLNLPDLASARERAVDEKRKQSGYLETRRGRAGQTSRGMKRSRDRNHE